MLSHMWNIRNKITEWVLQSRNRLTDTENTLVITSGERKGAGQNGVWDRYKLLGIRQTSNEDMLYNTGKHVLLWNILKWRIIYINTDYGTHLKLIQYCKSVTHQLKKKSTEGELNAKPAKGRR